MTTPSTIEVPRPTPEAEGIFCRWLTHLNDEFTRHHQFERRADIVRDELSMLLLGRPHRGRHAVTLDSDLPLDVALENLDPRNVSLAAEMPSRNAETLDKEKWMHVKPLIWFWLQFDRMALGQNLWLGFRFRNILGTHIFQHIGKDVYIYPGFTFVRGYNLSLADGTRIEPNVHIDDREPVQLSGTVTTRG
ncbi:MAG: hypothetical protein JSS87_08030 [Acidobacteria bacterium]|nr:hypothetical protein [Acidobacteriota bacterium]